MDETSIDSALQSVRASRTHQRDLLQGAQAQMDKRGTELDASLGSHVSAAERRSITDKARGALRTEIIRSTAPQRAEIMRTAIRHADAVRSAADHYASPAAMIIRDTIGSERRSRIQSQIELSGPKELASLASYAVATKDAELAAALLGRNSGLRPAKRSFSSAQLADAIAGDRFRAVRAAFEEIASSARMIINDDRAFTNGRPANHLDRLGRGLQKVEAGK